MHQRKTARNRNIHIEFPGQLKTKTWKNTKVHFKIHQHVWGNMQPKEISRMILSLPHLEGNFIVWILLFGFPEGAKWNNKSPTDLAVWKLGCQRTALESETAIQGV